GGHQSCGQHRTLRIPDTPRKRVLHPAAREKHRSRTLSLKLAPFEATGQPVDQYRALLQVIESISLNRDLPGLFHDLAERLHRVVRFDYLNLVLHVPERNTMRLRVLASSNPIDAPSSEIPVDETPSGEVWRTQVPLVIDDIDRDERYPKITELLRSHGARSICVLP